LRHGVRFPASRAAAFGAFGVHPLGCAGEGWLGIACGSEFLNVGQAQGQLAFGQRNLAAFRAAEVRSGRNGDVLPVYWQAESAAPLERSADSVVLTLSMTRADGIEKVAFRCRIATVMLQSADDSPDKLIERLAPWLEREFEQTREAALKTMRTEHRLLEISFDSAHPGPF